VRRFKTGRLKNGAIASNSGHTFGEQLPTYYRLLGDRLGGDAGTSI
jgi:hypothetical protein